MKVVYSTLRNEREKIVDGILLFYSIFIILPVASSLARISMLGFPPPFFFQLITVFSGWILYINRKKVPFDIKAWWIILIFMIAGFSGAAQFGVIGNGMTWMILGPSFGAILFGRKTGLYLGIGGLLALVLVGYLTITNGYVPFESTIPYSISFSTWYDFVFSFFFIAFVLVVATSRLNSGLVIALEKMRGQSLTLEKEVQSRTKELAEAHEKLLIHSRTDELTGLYSRYGLDWLVGELDKGHVEKKAYVVALELEDLKLCKELYGYERGNEYVLIFSKIIRLLELSEADRVARIDGEEFLAIVCSYESKKHLTDTLLRYKKLLVEELKRSFLDMKLQGDFSYGIASYEFNGDFESAVTKAKEDLYHINDRIKKHTTVNNYFLPNRFFNRLFKTGSIVVIIWTPDREKMVRYISDNVSNLLGYSNDAIMNGEVNYFDCIHPDDRDHVRQAIDRNISQQVGRYELTYRLKRSDGNYIWLRDHNIPVWEENQLIQINGTIYDITDVIEAEEEIEEASYWLKDIITATNIGTWEWNILNGAIKCNERFALIAGYTTEELTPFTMERWENLLYEEDRQSFKDNLEEHLSGEKGYYELECRINCKDGSIVWIYDRGRIMKYTDDGKPWLMMGTVSDVTDLKRTEAMLFHSEKLNALGRLSGGIAHDINNHLMMISSIADLASEADRLDIYQKNNQMIIDVVEKSGHLMQQLVSFTKHRVYEPREINLAALIRDTENIVRHTFCKGIVLNTDIKEENIYVEGDKSILNNMLINLYLNASEAMEENGILHISLEKLFAQKSFHTFTGNMPAGNYAIIRFIDNGIGIDQDHLDKIFEPFFTTKEDGSGVGLSSVARTVDDHRGGISVRSNLGEGTEFSVYLPLIKRRTSKTVDHQVSNEIERCTSDQISILLVDDEPVLSEVISEYLRLKGYHVTYFESPEKALDYCHTNQTSIDCALFDIIMPCMSGVELYDAIHSFLPDLPVIFLSGYSEGIELNDTYKDKIIAFVKKPIKLERLDELIRRWFDHQTSLIN